MRKSVFLFVAVLVSASLSAQRNDIYSSKPATSTVTVATAPVVSAQPVASSSTMMDVDAYNRRYSNSVAGGTMYDDGVIHDTVYVDTGYAQGYSDASDDYEYAIRMARFHSPYLRLFASRLYWDLAYTIFDPWYFDPWYYDPWYDPWFYGGPWYSGWYSWPSFYVGIGVVGGWYYGPIGPYVPSYYVYPAGRLSYASNAGFVPNRKLNPSWDRKLTDGITRSAETRYAINNAGTQSVRTSSPSAGNLRQATSVTARTSTSRSVSSDGSVRIVNPQSSSRSSIAIRNDGRISTSERSTSSTVTRNLNTTSNSVGRTSSNPRTNSVSSSARSVSPEGTYSRPSSTSRSSSMSSAISSGSGRSASSSRVSSSASSSHSYSSSSGSSYSSPSSSYSSSSSHSYSSGSSGSYSSGSHSGSGSGSSSRGGNMGGGHR